MENQEDNNNQIKKENSGCAYAIVIVIIFAAIIAFIIMAFNYNTDGTNNNNSGNSTPANTSIPQLFTRNATTNDISFKSSYDISLNYNFIITPNKEIKGLEMSFQFSNKDNKILYTKTKILGNVTSDVEYSVSFSISEFDIFDFFTISKFRAIVTGGTVSYFA